MNKEWVRAGIRLGKNPTAEVPCPVDASHGNLIVSDHYVAGSANFERVMECPKCGVRNILRMTYLDTFGEND